MALWISLARPMVVLAMLAGTSSGSAIAEEKAPMVRLAKLVIDASHLEAYRAYLAEEVKASMELEPGVRTLYAVSENHRPTNFTILEIYADRGAYEKHIKSPHFLKYKAGTEGMVKSLELVDAVPLVPDMKIK
jgi:quinol monooxygenase YgiN